MKLMLIITYRSAGLDPENLVTHFHEREEIHLLWYVALLCLSELVLRICKGFQSLFALLTCYVSGSLEVIECKDVL